MLAITNITDISVTVLINIDCAISFLSDLNLLIFFFYFIAFLYFVIIVNEILKQISKGSLSLSPSAGEKAILIKTGEGDSTILVVKRGIESLYCMYFSK